MDLAGTVATVKVVGSLLGGEQANTGFLDLSVAGTVSVGGSLVGGAGVTTGAILAGRVTSFTLGGSIIGGTADYAGYVSLGLTGKVSIYGSIQGGAGYLTGGFTASSVKTFTLNGSIYGGIAGNTGFVSLTGDTGTVTVKGGLFGHEATAASTVGSAAYLRADDATSVTILGGIHAGRTGSGTVLPYNGALFLEGNTGTVTIKGGLIGNNETKAYLLAEGQAVNPGDFTAIKSLSITGDVTHATIATGHVSDTAAVINNAENPDAGLGSLTVTGNWLHSSLLVGVNDTTNNGANLVDTRSLGDPTRLAKVGLVKITGRVLDDPASLGYSGFIAEKIAKITVGGATVFKIGDSLHFLDSNGFVIAREI